MRPLKVAAKTGFQIVDPYQPVIIRDFRGVLFYSTEPLTPRTQFFNLPPGTYFVQTGRFISLEKPVSYKLSKLPKIQREQKNPAKFKIVFRKNPHKCTIYWGLNLIVYDVSFREKPLTYIFYILYHEHGHRFYRDEHLADLYAKNKMLIKGYNPYQIGLAQMLSLSSRQLDRKNFIKNKLLSSNGNN